MRDRSPSGGFPRKPTCRRTRHGGLRSRQRLLGPDFDELHHSLEQALGAGGQFFARLASDDPDDGTTWRYDVVRDALTAAADPYFARVLGLYWVHTLANKTERFDYKLEADVAGGRR